MALAAREGQAQLEAFENYQKQSYRNRCYILSGDGPLMLQVPVVHGPSAAIRDVRIDYSTPWILRSQRALDAAYQASAYYEHYRDGVFGLLDNRPGTLWELNFTAAAWFLEKAGIPCRLSPTRSFAAPGSPAEDDYRYVIHPKKEDSILAEMGLERPYYQVFRDHLGGFTPKLSCLDLLFNEGPDSILWLKKL